MATKRNSIITPGMKRTMEDRKAKAKKNVPALTPEQEAFINGADVIVNNKKEQTEKKGRGRPATGIKKRKITFELSEELVNQLDLVVRKYGMTRSSFVSQAVMKAVKDYSD